MGDPFLLEVRSNLIIQTFEIVGAGRHQSFAASLKEPYGIRQKTLSYAPLIPQSGEWCSEVYRELIGKAADGSVEGECLVLLPWSWILMLKDGLHIVHSLEPALDFDLQGLNHRLARRIESQHLCGG